MIEIEKKISHFVESQFPSFYKEEGPQFVAFVKAYYEWLEQEGNPVYEARRLPDYKDIDSTLEEFIVFFKEKYLKNIQFDTATNKILLVKNSLDLYRSKGSERSVDLFFKLIYGTNADIRYPADNVLRVSDGVWEKPEYLEIGNSKFNVDYVGKQIIGSVSSSTAFVERYIRRRTNKGYVNLLYISSPSGNFVNGEIIGINVNGQPTYDLTKRSKLIGSVDEVILQDKSRGFQVGDLVNFDSDYRGIGGLARVASVENASGVIDFIFEDGGWGYTLNAQALISEKVLAATSLTPFPPASNTFSLFENLVEPTVNVVFNSATTSNMTVGTSVFRYSNSAVVSSGVITDIEQSSNAGSITISHTSGAFVNSATYYTTGNTNSFVVSEVENRTITGKIMGIPHEYTISVTGQVGQLTVGDRIYQKNTNSIIVSGVVSDITTTPSGNVLVISNTAGAFKLTAPQSDYYYSNGTGAVTSYASNNFVLGVGTSFDNEYQDAILYSGSNAVIGTVASVINSTAMTLTSTPTTVVASNTHAYALKFPLYVEGSSAVANVISISTSVGVYEIRKSYNVLAFTGANNSQITSTNYIYQYQDGNVSAKGKVVTAYESALAGNISIILVTGYFQDGTPIYTDSNTAMATLTTSSVETEGGDYYASPFASAVTSSSNTNFTLSSLSFGSGADFNVSTIGDTETIFIGTDLLSANNLDNLNYSRRNLSVASNTGFTLSDHVYQETNKIAFNPNTSFNKTTGAITLPTANTRYLPGDIVTYTTATGNTVIGGFANNDQYYVKQSNSTTIILSQVFNKSIAMTTTTIPELANGAISESGHYVHKLSAGKIFSLGSGLLTVKDIYNVFGPTAAGANTTVYGNTNAILYGNTSVNTSISAVTEYTSQVVANQAYMSLPMTADSYGFPKNTQGNIKDTIYSCLTFDSFTIGTIGALSGVDPGSEYNVDPYVLAYQPYISSFDRKDFIITVTNATSSYIIGEKINQTSANLVFYDLQVDGGVYSNTYIEKNIALNTQFDVNAANDFIYVKADDHFFNANTAVDGANDFITIANNTLVDGQYVRYSTSAGNTVISGLSNNGFYFIVSSNTTGVKLSTTSGGANVDIAASVANESGHNIISYVNTLSNDERLIYTTPVGNTAISGLSNNTSYYVTDSNTSGFALSVTAGGANVNITANSTGGETHAIRTIAGYLPNDKVFQNVLTAFNANTAVNATSEFITLTPQPYEDGDEVSYYTSSGNTVITGLANNTTYFVVESNTSGIKLSSTLAGSAINITQGLTEAGHNILAVANASISYVYKSGANSFVRVNAVENTLANNYSLFSYTNPYVGSSVSNIAFVSITSTAIGIIKPGSNTSSLRVKRLSFENTFIPGGTIVGDVSGASSIVSGVSEDSTELYPIGLNADITANVVTANGQISSLQVIDSGFGFSNSEIVQYTSTDGSRSGSIKIIVNGAGEGRGFYRSSKGFISSDMYLHDGDFYQEYSYEILSKMSFDKYSSMFKKVMHVAGTKFFGAVQVIEDANVSLTLAESSVSQADIV